MLITQVQRHAALVAVDAQKIAALTTLKWRSPRPRVVTDARLLDLEHVRAHVAQHLRTIRPRQRPAEIEHLYAIQWSGHGNFSIDLCAIAATEVTERTEIRNCIHTA